MKVMSLIREKNTLVPVEVELTLWPGLPGIQFIGLPDQHLKESALRIKSAIKHLDFTFPQAQQILVNLRPSYLKKNSRGIELAVAAAYLWETGQVPKPVLGSNFFIYGELTLSGEVIEPEDLKNDFKNTKATVLSGRAIKNQGYRFNHAVVRDLKELVQPQIQKKDIDQIPFVRPSEALGLKFSKAQAELIAISAAGEHSLLLTGAAGAGKSTIMTTIASLIKEPNRGDLGLSLEDQWRPIIRPHHTTPVMAMVGGGAGLFSGEIAKAHRGVLILDEFLEFHPHVIEALREPFENRSMRIARNGKAEVHAADSLILATSNLCPCGNWVPSGPQVKSCCYPIKKCRSYINKMSGPIIDRFEMLEFMAGGGSDLLILGSEILQNVQKAQSFQQRERGQVEPNSKLSLQQLESQIENFTRENLIPREGLSLRRKRAIFSIARTLADLDLSHKISQNHINKSLHWTYANFEKMKHWDF